MEQKKSGAVVLSRKDAELVGRALKAFFRDDSDIAFKNGDCDHETESERLFVLVEFLTAD